MTVGSSATYPFIHLFVIVLAADQGTAPCSSVFGGASWYCPNFSRPLLSKYVFYTIAPETDVLTFAPIRNIYIYIISNFLIKVKPMALPVRNRTNAWWVRATRATITPREDTFCGLKNFINPHFFHLALRDSIILSVSIPASLYAITASFR